VKTCIAILLLALLAACSRHDKATGPVRHYPVSGKIVALDSQHQTATIDAAAIPNYMEAMTMDYPIRSKDEFRVLKTGERITATLEVASDETYTLTNIKPASK
jgi:Cu/Ag efflux protein CusF